MQPKEIEENDQEVGKLAQPLWDYLQLGDQLIKSDAVIVTGSQDLRIPEWGANLVLKGWADLVVMSGGVGRLTPPEWKDGEAAVFADVAYKAGLPKEKVVADNRSTITRENILYAWEDLKQKGVDPKRLIFISQPFMQRRMKKLVEKMIKEGLLSEIEAIFPSSPLNYSTYPNEVVSKTEMISIMVGEVQRLVDYPTKGFIAHEHVPNEILTITDKLSQLGHTKYSI
jgi:uncharacterized SAM-binding protein YcdF (DUF218 family)